jgi:hypothetical protein
MFDLTRRWAYRERRKESYSRSDRFIAACVEHAGGINAGFPVPLSQAEVRATGRSIGKWTWKNMSPEGFHAWCVRKGKAGARASAIVRGERSKALAEEAKALHTAGKTQQQIAKIMELNQGWISRLLRS